MDLRVYIGLDFVLLFAIFILVLYWWIYSRYWTHVQSVVELSQGYKLNPLLNLFVIHFVSLLVLSIYIYLRIYFLSNQESRYDLPYSNKHLYFFINFCVKNILNPWMKGQSGCHEIRAMHSIKTPSIVNSIKHFQSYCVSFNRSFWYHH